MKPGVGNRPYERSTAESVVSDVTNDDDVARHDPEAKEQAGV